MEIKDKKVLVLGLGKSGQAAIRLLEHFGAKITINDGSPKEKIAHYDEYINKGMEVIYGGMPDELFEKHGLHRRRDVTNYLVFVDCDDEPEIEED